MSPDLSGTKFQTSHLSSDPAPPAPAPRTASTGPSTGPSPALRLSSLLCRPRVAAVAALDYLSTSSASARPTKLSCIRWLSQLPLFVVLAAMSHDSSACPSPPRYPSKALPLLLLRAACCIALARAQEEERRKFPPIPKADPISDGVFLRTVELPPLPVDGDGDEGSGSGSGIGDVDRRTRQRLIMYDFRPAFPPYTKESLAELLLIPMQRELVGAEGQVGSEEGEAKSEETGDDDVGGGGPSPGEERQVQEVNVTGEEVEESERLDDPPTAGDSTDDEAEIDTADAVPEEGKSDAIDEAGEPRLESSIGEAKSVSDGSEEHPSISNTKMQEREGDAPHESDGIPLAEAEEKISIPDHEIGPNKDGEVESGSEDVVGEEMEPTSGTLPVADTSESDTHTPEAEYTQETEEEREQKHQQESGTVGINEEDQSTEYETETVEQPHKIISEEKEAHGSLDENSSPPDVGAENELPLEKDFIGDDVDKTSGVDSSASGYNETSLESKEATDVDSELVGSESHPTKEGGDTPETTKSDSLPIEEKNPSSDPKRESEQTDAGPKERITVDYDDDSTISTTTATSSSNINKEANRKFVDGLDEIDKLFESVEVPDELDVGADGSSMQDVLVGQGLKIIWKRARNFGKGVRSKFEDAAESVRKALPLGMLGGDEEEEDVSLESLLDLSKLAEGGLLADKRNEKEVLETESSGSTLDKERQSKRKKDKRERNKEFPLIKTKKAQGLWKFARRKWEQAKHVLDDLLSIFEGRDDEDDGDFGLGDMKPVEVQLGRGATSEAAAGSGLKGDGVPNLGGKFGSEVDESFLKSRYEAMMMQQQKTKK
ncbi:hypothetical protein ACHAWF_014342 [Thalassiosira exigua]